MQESTASSPAPSRQVRSLIGTLTGERVLAVVRAPVVPDVVALCEALVAGGVLVVELTLTVPDVKSHLEAATRAAAETGAWVGAGTVLDATDARDAVAAGAQFLVTPGLGCQAAEIVRIGHDAGVDVMLGACTPSEVMTAVQFGADVVKVFPARLGGPTLLSDLRGPFPNVPLVPSGGVSPRNARSFLDAGATAVSAGTSVVAPTAVAAADWARIARGAREFCDALAEFPNGVERVPEGHPPNDNKET